MPAPGGAAAVADLPAVAAGTKSVLYIRVAYADSPTAEPQSLTDAQAMMDTVNQFMQSNSWGQLSLATAITGLVVLPQTQAYYISAGDRVLQSDARSAAAAANPAWNYLNYTYDVVRFNGGPGAYLGQAYVGTRGLWLKASLAEVAQHELGHNLGLYHANAWVPNDPQTIVGPGSNSEYADPFDSMGGSGSPFQQFNNYEKNKLGWLGAGNVTTITASGTYRLYAEDLGGQLQPTDAYALRICKDADRDYWLEFRQNSAWASNSWVENGILVRWGAWSASNGSELLDMTPNSPDGLNDAALVLGRTFDDDASGIHITPIARYDTSPPSMDVVVTFDDPATDRPPTAAISASASTVAAGGAVSFSATASDPDGDALSYFWDFGDKTFASGPVAGKSWPAAGQYRVRLTVSDMKGQSASESVLVTVASPVPQTYNVSGRVLDCFGSPLADVRITNGLDVADPGLRSAYSDSDGSFTLTGLVPGSYSMAANKAGWSFAPANFLRPLSIGPNLPPISFTGTAAAYRVTGRITDGVNSIAGAIVTDGTRCEPTAPDGSYSLYVPDGIYTVSVTKSGYTFPTKTLTVQYGDVAWSPIGTGSATQAPDLPPTVAAAASATVLPNQPVSVSVLGADDLGQQLLTYTWSTPSAGRGRRILSHQRDQFGQDDAGELHQSRPLHAASHHSRQPRQHRHERCPPHGQPRVELHPR